MSAPKKEAPPRGISSEAAQGEQLTLIDPPPFSPALPTANTLPDKLLWVLLAGGSVDHPQFEGATGSWRLAAAAHVLRELGWPVETHLVPAPTEEAPERCIAWYRLKADAIAAGRELLRGGGE